ncbi:threonine-phosphate decarboxylase [Jannaschia sp. Os4]|uniref:threonine-phosphate decarboxylase n=1 Tax=Jannaschia sp. Os4 TaxID=2807617 RepID=UPI001EED5309|nr:threonine-phosphate decarboxylase [Jannaschia sp. Os4]
MRDHGGGLAAARARWGGEAAEWLDLSTGINPVPYPLPDLIARDWQALPDADAFAALEAAARAFWDVPDAAMVLAAPGASALIAKLPMLAPPGPVRIPGPTYNEHAAAFRAHSVPEGQGDALVVVHPNNPDGRLSSEAAAFTVIDESFCDVTPEATRIAEAAAPGRVVLKSFGKFWGLAGLRLGFAIGHPGTLAPLAEAIGPWAVSGPALRIGARALSDPGWARATRARLATDAARLDALMAPHGALAGGTDLFRLWSVPDAESFAERMGRARILVRTFPYSGTWVRLGLPAPGGWARLEAALC